ncbi:hypothetical protein HU200_018582 [Digitaria exilis]|uniref:DUF6598 domain-containing protein n=1 Tax=Digitaria exilis TaxID=1010633 RepID=A0A835KGK8_9POAL|nr:hypothetical protein HU200_018582 [Digitaria exilis]
MEADGDIDNKGKDEAAKSLPMRRLREIDEMGKGDCSIEVVERQKRMKETDADPDDKEMEVVVSEDDELSDFDEEEAKRWYEEEYLVFKRNEEQEFVQECLREPDRLQDRLAYQAKMYRENWNPRYGSFDKKTEIPCKRFTHNPAPRGNTVSDTLQVFYVKVGELSGGLQFPLKVFGMVALRDSFDFNRNVIFERERDNCQELTDENPYLTLTGPVRAVVIYSPVIFEATLYVKGATRSNDKELSLLATSLGLITNTHSSLVRRSYTSRLSTLDLMLAYMTYSVEATIEVRVTSGSWPDGFRCRFVASTDSIGQAVVLLETANDQVPLSGDEIILARQVVSVESHGKLNVLGSISNSQVVYTDSKDFKPLKMGTSTDYLHLGRNTLEVTIFWSCFEF